MWKTFWKTDAVYFVVLTMLSLVGCSLPLVSEEQITLQSSEQFQEMREQLEIAQDPADRAYVFCVARAIAATLEPPYSEIDWDIEVFQNDAVNAFAMPGGKIGVFTGILDVAVTQDQLGAVLGHEVAHVTLHHSVERANQTITTQLGASAVGMATGSQMAADMVGLGAQMGILLPYGRGQESEADVVGLKFMANAGFDPDAAVTLWQNMAKANANAPPEFMSTHPSSSSRIRDLQRQMAPNRLRYKSARMSGRVPNCRR
ncbi:MAG: M48 family metallopeptidase [Gammaproteobacteria bacterium]|nr:M48 family metallopeptidase [Gammaproteobacteria bacterium]